jgi:hypothetical protein
MAKSTRNDMIEIKKMLIAIQIIGNTIVVGIGINTFLLIGKPE